MTLAIEVADDQEAKRVFTALGEGGKVTMPLMKTFWTSSFGMLTDKFGVPWMVNVAASKA
jgi:PhnB protein